MLAVAGLFTVGGVSEAVSSNSGNILNWIGAVFFGLCTIGFVYMIFFADFKMTPMETGSVGAADVYPSSGTGPMSVILR